MHTDIITTSKLMEALGYEDMTLAIEEAITKLLQQGRIFEPSPGKYKSIT